MGVDIVVVSRNLAIHPATCSLTWSSAAVVSIILLCSAIGGWSDES